MNILFELQPVPDWIPADNRFCRACDSVTKWVLTAKDKSYTYPCCNNNLCQNIVRQQITEAMAAAEMSAQ